MKKSIKSISGAVALALLAGTGTANALVINFSDAGPGSETTEISQTLNLGLFDSNLGILTSVTLTVNGQSATTISLQNNGAETETVNAITTVDLDFTASNGVAIPSLFLSMPTGNQVIASGGSAGPFGLADADTTAVLGPLAAFQQAGGGALTIGCESLSGLSLKGGGGNIAAQQETTAGCSADVEYNYTPRVQVPEPATMAMLGLGLLGLNMARRRVRK